METPKQIEPTAYHKWLFKLTEGNPAKLANQLVSDVVNNQNPQAFELLAQTCDTEYTPETFIKAAKILCEILGEHTPNYYIPTTKPLHRVVSLVPWQS